MASTGCVTYQCFLSMYNKQLPALVASYIAFIFMAFSQVISSQIHHPTNFFNVWEILFLITTRVYLIQRLLQPELLSMP